MEQGFACSLCHILGSHISFSMWVSYVQPCATL